MIYQRLHRNISHLLLASARPRMRNTRCENNIKIFINISLFFLDGTTRTGTMTSPGTPVCMTCDVGPGCLYVSAEFSTNGKYYIRKCLGPDIPSYTLIGIKDGLGK